MGGRAPSCDAAMLEIIEEGNEICTPDPDRKANVLLLQARVSFDDGQYAVLHRTDFESGKASQEIAKHGELGLPEGISNKVGKMTEVDCFGRRIWRTTRSLSRLGCLRHQARLKSRGVTDQLTLNC